MAKQKGIIKLEGTIAGVTFYKTSDGYLAKEVSSLTAERIATDPAFNRTRENGAEFGRAGKAARLLRTAFRSRLQQVRDPRMFSRLVGEMMKVVQADAISIRGMRNVVDGEIELLQGLDFNINSKLASTLFAPFETAIDRTTGKLTASLATFVPAQSIAWPSGATHFRISLLGAEIDFAAGSFKADNKETSVLPLDTICLQQLSTWNPFLRLPALTLCSLR